MERGLLAGAFAALFAVVFVVSGAAIVAYGTGHTPYRPLLLASLSITACLVLGGLAGVGKGPLRRLAKKLPEEFDGAFRRRRLRAVLVAILTIVGLVQVARLSCFMADDQLRWGSAFPPVREGVEHMCLASYLQAAELAGHGAANVYAEAHYPAYWDQEFGSRERTATSGIDHIEPYIEDAYEYPPPFLLLPKLALALSNDYRIHRTAWFLLQMICFLAVAMGLTRHLSGPSRRVALLLIPGLLATFPGMITFQFGQWHLAAFMLALTAMLAFTQDRHRLGGALLGAATVTKLFPGLLVLVLLAQRRWRPVMWTAAFSGLYCLLGLAALGIAPYAAFFEYHLPRILSGDAFSFFLKSDLTLASNYAVYGIPFKLQRLGVPGMTQQLASYLALVYGAIVVLLAIWVARHNLKPHQWPAVWLALLVLASLRSPLAPHVYAAMPALWLLTLVADRAGNSARSIGVVVFAWLTMGGLPPLEDPKATIALWMLGQVSMLCLGLWVVTRYPKTDARPSSTASTAPDAVGKES